MQFVNNDCIVTRNNKAKAPGLHDPEPYFKRKGQL